MRLFLAHERRVRGFIRSLVPNWSDANDLLQETATTLWQKFDDFEEGTDFNAWALSVARFRVLNYRKAMGRRRLRFSETSFEALAELARSDTDGSANDADRLEVLHRCLGKLPADERALVTLRYEPGATVKSVAEAAGKTANAVYKLLNRIHRQLLYCVRSTLEARPE